MLLLLFFFGFLVEIQKETNGKVPVVFVGNAAFAVVVVPGPELDGAAFATYDSVAAPDDYRLNPPAI